MVLSKEAAWKKAAGHRAGRDLMSEFAEERKRQRALDSGAAEDIWSAATLKGRYPIAYADAFAAAMAQEYNCPLVTGDAGFRSVDQLQLEWMPGPEPH